MGTATGLLHNEVVRVDCARWRDGRVVLVGDAAHAMAPTAGQGANSALVDAAVLTAELASEPELPVALERYARRRRTTVRKVQTRADQLTRLTALRRPEARVLRDLGLRAALVRCLSLRSGDGVGPSQSGAGRPF